MGFFDIFSGGPFDFNGDGKEDSFEMATGFMFLDRLSRERKREREKQKFANDLLLNAAQYGVEYTDEEIEEILADSERLGLLD